MRADPTQYARYSDHRSRPFFDLVAQIGADSPGTVVDGAAAAGHPPSSPVPARTYAAPARGHGAATARPRVTCPPTTA